MYDVNGPAFLKPSQNVCTCESWIGHRGKCPIQPDITTLYICSFADMQGSLADV